MPIGSLIYFTDSHLTDGASVDRRAKYKYSGPRFYSEAEGDIDEAVATANSLDVDAIVEGGDFIELHSDNALTNENNNGTEGEAILQVAEAAFAAATMPRHHVPGNWDMFDYDFQNPQDWFQYVVNGTPATVILPTETTYATYYTDALANDITRFYAFEFGDAIGIVLDTTGITEDGDDYQGDSGHRDNGTHTFVGAKQRAWLTAFLAANTTKPIIVFCHSWIYPFDGMFWTGYQSFDNCEAIAAILEAAPGGNVIAVFQGHHHPGTQGWWVDEADDIIDMYLHPYYYSNPLPGVAVGTAWRITFPMIRNGIKYFCCRGQIVGWGDSAVAPTTDEGSPLGEATPANAYYLIEVLQPVLGKWDVRVTGYGANPVGASAEPSSYLIG